MTRLAITNEGRGIALRAMLSVLASVALLGCNPIDNVRGYVGEELQAAQIVPGQTAVQEVEEIMGTPSLVSALDPNAWYYVSSEVETVAFLKPGVVNRHVLAIRFNGAGTVEEVARFGLDEGLEIDFDDDATPTRGRQLSLLDEIFGNIGRFNQVRVDAPQ